jgi:K+-transporting ATPase ATPase B chain
MFRTIMEYWRAAPLTYAKRLDSPGDLLSAELTLGRSLRAGDHVLCVAGDVVPRDGYVVAGSEVRDAAATGTTSCPVYAPRARGTIVKSGTLVRASYLVIRVCDAPG